MKNGESFFDRLETLRGNRTKASFAMQLGASAPLYQKWAKGSIPGGDKLNSISKATGKSVEWLLTGQEGFIETVKTDFRDRVIVARAMLGTTLMELARKMGVETAELQRIVDRQSEPTLALVNAFEVNVEPLVEEARNLQGRGMDRATLRAELKPIEDALAEMKVDLGLIKKLLSK